MFNINDLNFQLVSLPIKSIKRKLINWNDEGIDKLVESIKKYGVINPVVVVPLKNDNQYQWRTISGARRLCAAWKSNLSEIPAIIVTKNLDSEEEKLLSILESEVGRKITKKEKKEIMNDMKKNKNRNKRNKVRTYEINE